MNLGLGKRSAMAWLMWPRPPPTCWRGKLFHSFTKRGYEIWYWEETGTYIHNSCISEARPIESPEYELRIHWTSRSAQRAHSKAKAVTCFRIILENIKGRLFLSKSESQALFPRFLSIYRVLFEPFRVLCCLEVLSIPFSKCVVVSYDTYSWIYFFAIMSNHRAEFLVSSNSSGASAMFYGSGFWLVEESIRHCILHDSSYAVFVEADFLGYIRIAISPSSGTASKTLNR